MTNNGKVLSALLLGGVAGAVLGILFAPDKGSETRKKIAKNTDSIIDQLNQKIEDGKSVLSNLRRKATDTAEEVKSTINDFDANDSKRGKSTTTMHSR